MTQVSLHHNYRASLQIAEQITTVNLVALRGFRLWWCCFQQWLRINITGNFQSRVIVTFYIIYRLAIISEVKLKPQNAYHVFE